jgi:two-component system chemotaxis response regulator CheY
MNVEVNVQELSFLVVDDDSLFLGTIAGILQSMGATKILAAVSGSDALSKLATFQRPVDCVLCDLKMPNGNGLQLLQAIRLGMAKPVRPDACFIIITSAADAELIKAAGQLDANGYVVKPVTREKLSAAIARGRARGFPLNVNQYQSIVIPVCA